MILIVSTPAKATVPAVKLAADFKVKSNTSAVPVAFAKVTVVDVALARTVSPTPAATFVNVLVPAPTSRALNVCALCVALPTALILQILKLLVVQQ